MTEKTSLGIDHIGVVVLDPGSGDEVSGTGVRSTWMRCGTKRNLLPVPAS